MQIGSKRGSRKCLQVASGKTLWEQCPHQLELFYWGINEKEKTKMASKKHEFYSELYIQMDFMGSCC